MQNPSGGLLSLQLILALHRLQRARSCVLHGGDPINMLILIYICGTLVCLINRAAAGEQNSLQLPAGQGRRRLRFTK
jgi:hypothetical protein